MNSFAHTSRFSTAIAALPANVDAASPSEEARPSKCPFTRLMKFLFKGWNIKTGSQSTKASRTVMSWIQNFVAKAHPELGRSGPVCPFLPRALRENSLTFQTVDANALTDEQLDQLVKQHAAHFLAMEPTSGKARLNKTIVLIFQGIADKDACSVIEAAHSRLKPYFVERGLMLGEFHKSHQAPGVHNVNFRPLQSPLPLLVIRYMVPSDLQFLDRDGYAPELRESFVRSYKQIFA